jgi:hypothetical protein
LIEDLKQMLIELTADAAVGVRGRSRES